MIDANMKEDTLNNTNCVLLGLLKRALFGEPFSFAEEDLDWAALLKDAKAQAVQLLLYDCLTAAERASMPQGIEERWRLSALQVFRKNITLAHEQEEILQTFRDVHIDCSVLKGSTCAKNYPKSELRCAGDIDLVVAKKDIRQAQALLESNGYVVKGKKCPWHIAMCRDNVIVELHFEPAGLPDGKIGEELKQYFRTLPRLDGCQEAVALLLHKLNHIRNGGLGLRQLCDWALFVKEQIDADVWKALEPQLRKFGLLQFAKVVTRLCVDYLGLDRAYAPWCMDTERDVVLALLEDILQTGNFGCKENRYGQHLFTDGGPGGRIKSLWRVGTKTCQAHWPVCKRYPLLLSVAPFLLVAQHIKLRCSGKQPPFHLFAAFHSAKPRQRLYQMLKPFEQERA